MSYEIKHHLHVHKLVADNFKGPAPIAGGGSFTLNTAAGELTGGDVVDVGDVVTLGLADVVPASTFMQSPSLQVDAKGRVVGYASAEMTPLGLSTDDAIVPIANVSAGGWFNCISHSIGSFMHWHYYFNDITISATGVAEFDLPLQRPPRRGLAELINFTPGPVWFTTITRTASFWMADTTTHQPVYAEALLNYATGPPYRILVTIPNATAGTVLKGDVKFFAFYDQNLNP